MPPNRKKASTRRETDLGAAELDVLKVLWGAGPSTCRDVMSRLHESGRKVAYTTVLTFLSRLEQKGFVTADKSGQAYVYRARQRRDRVVNARIRTLKSQLFDGAAAPMVLHLMQNESFSSEELAELQQLIDDLASRSGDQAKPRRRKG